MLSIDVWRRFVAPRNRELTDAGAAGELVVARARLVLSGLIVIVPIINMLDHSAGLETVLGFTGAMVTVLMSIGVLIAVSRGWRPRWLGFATSLFDVTVVSCVLASFLAVDPIMAVNSRTTFEVYFLALGATCLRYDQRICIVAGVMAAAQYALLVIFTTHHWTLVGPSVASDAYGTFSWTSEVSRVVILLGITILNTTIVDRSVQLRLMSTHDGLTTLYNRAYFTERLREELLRAERYHRPVAVAIIDLDHFKSVNDRWGHLVGDVVLRAVAERLREGMRRTDIVARYGGEEFAIFFPETGNDEALKMLERAQSNISSVPVVIPGASEPVRITFSGGVASTISDGTSFDMLMARADSRLLVAKNAGRDRIVGAMSSGSAGLNASRGASSMETGRVS